MQAKYWSVGEVALVLGVSSKWAYQSVNAGKIPGAFKLRGRWFIDREEFEEGLKRLSKRSGKSPVVSADDKHGLFR